MDVKEFVDVVENEYSVNVDKTKTNTNPNWDVVAERANKSVEPHTKVVTLFIFESEPIDGISEWAEQYDAVLLEPPLMTSQGMGFQFAVK